MLTKTGYKDLLKIFQLGLLVYLTIILSACTTADPVLTPTDDPVIESSVVPDTLSPPTATQEPLTQIPPALDSEEGTANPPPQKI